MAHTQSSAREELHEALTLYKSVNSFIHLLQEKGASAATEALQKLQEEIPTLEKNLAELKQRAAQFNQTLEQYQVKQQLPKPETHDTSSIDEELGKVIAENTGLTRKLDPAKLLLVANYQQSLQKQLTLMTEIKQLMGTILPIQDPNEALSSPDLKRPKP